MSYRVCLLLVVLSLTGVAYARLSPESPAVTKRFKELLFEGILARVPAKTASALIIKQLGGKFEVEGVNVGEFDGGINNEYIADGVKAFLADQDIMGRIADNPALMNDYANLELTSGLTFMHYLKTESQLKTMLAAGGDINAKAWYGYTPLMQAILRLPDTEVAKAMIEVPGIDVNAVGGFGGTTALGNAVYKRKTDVVRALLQHPDIDINIPLTPNRVTALEQASKYDDPEGLEIAELLRIHDALDKARAWHRGLK